MAETQGPSVARICAEGGFLGAQHERNERRTWAVVAVAAAMMLAEIIGGSIFNSMALVADGWHMSTHAGTLTIAALAYGFARRHAGDSRFAWGSGKVGELAGFASAIVLGVISLLIGWELAQRLLHPRAILFDEAIVIACAGLAVNLVSAWLLHAGHDHGPPSASHDHGDHDHAHAHAHAHAHEDEHDLHHHSDHHDNNLRAAYLHIVADAVISVLAIGGLMAGRFLGWVWLDPVVGIVGALVIANWSWTLARVAGCSLLDVSINPRLPQAVRARLESGGDQISDLHLWRLGPGHQALIVSIQTAEPAPPETYKAKLAGLPGLSHVTVEVNAR